jgi:ATP-dependent Clp protease, protease subunit
MIKRIFAAAKKENTVELTMYDQIGGGFFSDGITAADVKKKLDEAGDVSKIVVRLNSPGGSVFEGVAIYNLLAQHGAPVHVFVDGVAASIASVIAMAGAKISMGQGSMLMIHNAWIAAMGDSKELRSTADLLDKISTSSVRNAYVNRTGMKGDEVQSLMDAETWMTAEEAVAQGFADEVLQVEKDDAAKAKALAASFELNARFQHTPDSLKAQPEASQVDSKPATGIIPDVEAGPAVAANIDRMKKRVRIAQRS